MNKNFKTLLPIVAFCLVALTNSGVAGQTKKTGKKKSGDAFQLTLSDVPFSKDPQSAFVRQTCAPGKSDKNQQK